MLKAGKFDLTTLGSFEVWADLVAGAVEWLTGTNPINLIEKRKGEDPTRAAERQVIAALFGIFRENEWLAKEAVGKPGDGDMPASGIDPALWDGVISFKGKDRPTAAQLGVWLRKRKDKVMGDWQLVGRIDRNDITHWGVRGVLPPAVKKWPDKISIRGLIPPATPAGRRRGDRAVTAIRLLADLAAAGITLRLVDGKARVSGSPSPDLRTAFVPTRRRSLSCSAATAAATVAIGWAGPVPWGSCSPTAWPRATPATGGKENASSPPAGAPSIPRWPPMRPPPPASRQVRQRIHAPSTLEDRA